jgi:hypothetical protein
MSVPPFRLISRSRTSVRTRTASPPALPSEALVVVAAGCDSVAGRGATAVCAVEDDGIAASRLPELVAGAVALREVPVTGTLDVTP